MMYGLERVTVRGLAAGVARARLAHADHEHLGVHGLEAMVLLEVPFQLAYELLFDVEHTAANLTHGMVVVSARQLVVGRPLPKVGRVNGARSGERLQRAVHGAARKARLGLVQLGGYLVGGAMPAQANDRVVDHRPLGCTSHPRGQDGHETGTTRSDLS